MSRSWSNGSDTYEERGGDIYRNHERVGYMSGDEMIIGDDRVRIHPHDGDVYLNNERIGWRDGGGSYHVGDSEWDEDD